MQNLWLGDFNRSASPESLSNSASPPRGASPRSRSTSPVKIIANTNNVTIEVKRKHDSPRLERSSTNYKFANSLERKLSNPHEYHTKNHQTGTMERNSEKQASFIKPTADTLLRMGLPSLQPFNKTEKTFRPINFNPVINKLAQPVN